MDERIKRWTAKSKTVLVIEIIKGKTTVVDPSRYQITPKSGKFFVILIDAFKI